MCLIVAADAGDSLTFVVNDPKCKFDAGTTITMFKVDDLQDLHVESIPSDPLITDDFTINNFSIDGRSAQYNKVGIDQVPFSLGIPGPLSLRGRRSATTETPPNVSTGQKKN